MSEGKIAGFEKKTVLIVVIIVVVVLGGYYFATHNKKKKSASSKANASAQYVTGTLTAQDANSLTIKMADGSSQTVVVNATTRMSKKNKGVQASSLPIGDQVKIKVSGTGGNLSAMVVEDTSISTSTKTKSTTAAPATIPAAGTVPTTGTSTTPTTGTTAPAASTANTTAPAATATPTPVN
ncbi:MAG: hypothetical protein P4L62_01410 [Candidatus Pacebacteria bacterium]|nr:hypothetical protein [Candidatus Paceibacterota bacterium]